MSEGKHTPGEWRYGKRADGSIWISMGDPAKGRHAQFNWHGFEEDARFSAAAPDMYEALKWAATVIRPGSDLREAMDAALAKAKGE